MVMFGRHEGFEVRSHAPPNLAPWATEALFNSYLVRLLVQEGVDKNAFRFERGDDFRSDLYLTKKPPIKGRRERLQEFFAGEEIEPLTPDGPEELFPGWMAISRK